MMPYKCLDCCGNILMRQCCVTAAQVHTSHNKARSAETTGGIQNLPHLKMVSLSHNYCHVAQHDLCSGERQEYTFERPPAACTPNSPTHRRFSGSNHRHVHVFSVWEETRAPGEAHTVRSILKLQEPLKASVRTPSRFCVLSLKGCTVT